jgi:methyl-accepting chemotaxis protein
MKSSPITKLAGFIAALALASAGFAAPSLASKDAPDMLSQLHQDAQQVRDAADQLETYNREPFLAGWQANAEMLQSMRRQINQMDRTLYRLHTIEGTLPRNEQAEINEVTPAMVELTDTAQLAINFVRNHEDRVWMPKYTAYADEMYNEANRIEGQTATTGVQALNSGKVTSSTQAPNSSNGD